MDEARKDINLIASKLYGNGHKGLVAEVFQNKTSIKTMKWFMGVGFTALGVLITVFSIV